MWLTYVLAGILIILAALIWIGGSTILAAILDPEEHYKGSTGNSWGGRLANRWMGNLDYYAARVTVYNIRSRVLVLQIFMRLMWLAVGVPLKWILCSVIFTAGNSIIGAAALLRSMFLRIRHILLYTEEPAETESAKPYTGDWTVIWRIQACGKNPREAVWEAYDIFRNPGEALTFEVVKGVTQPDQDTVFIDLFAPENEPEEVGS